jgi:putative heme-binding domain-containing protein
LSETGLFTGAGSVEPAPGVATYSVQAEIWQDDGIASRVVGIPGGAGVNVQTNDGKWAFPADSVFAQTYSLELERGNPKSSRKIETRLLHFTGVDWNAYSYRWDEEERDATLVPAAGAERILQVRDAAGPGGERRQTWRFHSRAECLRCHNQWGNFALGFNLQQLTSASRDQLARSGVLTPAALGQNPGVSLANPHDPTADPAARARSWLHANCAHCHRFGAGGSVAMRLDFNEPLDKSALIGARALQGDFGLPGGQLIAGGDPFRSVLFYRVSKLGKGHMPYLGSRKVDERGLAVLQAWIAGMAVTPVADASAQARIANQQVSEERLAQELSDPKFPDATTNIVRLLESPRGALALLTAVANDRLAPAHRALAIEHGTGHPETRVRELFERHVPEEKRIKTLGTDFPPSMVLNLRGDAERGQRLFAQDTGLQCQACHRVNGSGRDFGPDLSHIAGKYPEPARLLEQLLLPSKTVEPKFQACILERKDGNELSGIIEDQNEREIVVRTTTLGSMKIPRVDVARMDTLQNSLMPEGLLQALTAQEAADLLAYLSSLK